MSANECVCCLTSECVQWDEALLEMSVGLHPSPTRLSLSPSPFLVCMARSLRLLHTSLMLCDTLPWCCLRPCFYISFRLRARQR